jgi:D-ribose pyranose/furanose isomerase RbsD
MKVLSIDVGIKNLALCLFDIESKEKYEILKWDVVSLCNETVVKCSCGKPAKYRYICQKDEIETYYCKKHCKEINNPIIPKELELQKIKKIKINELRELLTKYEIEFDIKKSKVHLLEYLENELKNKYILPFSNTVKTSELSLVDIGINMKNVLDKLYDEIKIDTVIIENQISPIANRMKTLQGMIAQYFIMKNTIDIQFVSAANKLKEYVNTKTTYNERKHKGIEICEEILVNNEPFGKHLDMFHGHKKKDDLADCFLQGIWYLRNKIIYY